MAKYGPPIYYAVSEKETERLFRERRGSDGARALPSGFTNRAQGREGFIYYREQAGQPDPGEHGESLERMGLEALEGGNGVPFRPVQRRRRR